MTHKLGAVPPLKMGTKTGKHPKKSTPKGIDPAYPQKNFVKASYENKGEDPWPHMYGSFPGSGGERVRKASGFGHSIGQRAGKLRTSGNPNAHRIGKRGK